ncbi:TPA: TadE/TadG family type IV pilus assembly protein, partial [Burkholderia cenocepacia]
RAGLSYAPNLTTRVANAKTTTQNVLGWLNSSPPNVVAQQCNYNSTPTPLLYCLTVTVSYTPDSWMTIMPFLGAIITKPLTGTAVVQIPQSML